MLDIQAYKSIIISVERKKRIHIKMRYEVRLINENLTGKSKTILETESRYKAFMLVETVKELENSEPYCNYDEVRVLDNGEWLARVRLY